MQGIKLYQSRVERMLRLGTQRQQALGKIVFDLFLQRYQL